MYRQIQHILVRLLSFFVFCAVFACGYVYAFQDAGLVNGFVRSEYSNGKGTGTDYQTWLTVRYDQRYSEWWYYDYGVNNYLPLDQWFGCLFSPRGTPSWWGYGVSYRNTKNDCPGYRTNPNVYPLPDPRRAAYAEDYWRGLRNDREACGGPLTIGNSVGDSWKSCVTYQSNTFYSNSGPNVSQYWMIHANSDPAWDQCNEGPPGMSHFVTDPISNPNPNLYKVGMEPLANGKKRAHIIVAPGQHDFVCATNATKKRWKLPFLSVGAQNGRGSFNNFGSYYWSWSAELPTIRPYLQFTSKLYNVETIGCKPDDNSIYPVNGPDPNLNLKLCDTSNVGYHTGIYLLTSWNGTNRLLFVDLAAEGVLYSSMGAVKMNWSWPIEESVFYPGAEGLTMTASWARNVCGINIPDLPKPISGIVESAPAQAYSIDLIKLLRCVIPAYNINYSGNGGQFSNPPNQSGWINISGIHWFAEVVGTSGGVWVSFENPQIVNQ